MTTRTHAAIVAAVISVAASAVSAAPFTFVSAPDFLNVDVGDLSGYNAFNAPSGNSTSASWEASVGGYLDAIAAEKPDFVAVVGDLVMARWFQDAYFDGVFQQKFADKAQRDANSTVAIERDRVVNATDFYYGAWKQRFTDRGLVQYSAVGDHELGDDPSWADSFGKQTISTYRDQFSTHFVDGIQSGTALAANSTFVSSPTAGQHAGTAYAVRHDNTLLVTVDVFKRDTATNAVSVTVADEQLAWLEQTLDAANADPSIDHVIVQGHTPVLGPVADRVSSSLMLEGGADSEFWKLLRDKGVTTYLNGEVHAVTVLQDQQAPGLTQIAHGGILGFEQADSISYMVGTVDGATITLDMKQLGVAVSGGQFYQPGNPTTRIKDNVNFVGGPQSIGSVVIDTSGRFTRYRNASGVFAGLVSQLDGDVTYQFDGNVIAQKSPTGQAEGASFSAFRLSGISEETSGSENANRLATKDGWSTSDAFNDNYVGFSITSDDGAALTLDGISFDINRANGIASHRDGRLLVSLDGGNSFETIMLFEDLETFDGRQMSTEGNATTRFTLFDDDLNLAASTMFEFRFQFADTDGVARTIRIDAVSVAVSAVPEPGAAATVLLMMGGLLNRRRRADG